MTIDPMHPLSTMERLETAAISWLTGHASPRDDMLIGVAALLLLWLALWLAFTPTSGTHRAGFLLPRSKRQSARDFSLIVNRKPIERAIRQLGDDLFAFETEQAAQRRAGLASGEVEHHDADTFHPAAEMRVVDTPDAEWEALMARARRELHELHDDDAPFFEQWDAMVANFRAQIDASLATADAWHAEHGAHCECCHVVVSTGEHKLIDRGWRIGEHTVEIPVAQLVAAGVR